MNPGCPSHEGYFDISDLVVVSERSHQSFTNPSPEKGKFQIFKRALKPGQAPKLLLPKTSNPQHWLKFGIIDHSFLPEQLHETKLVELRKLVHRLVSTTRVGALFITDVDLEKSDVFAEWSSFWPELLVYVSEADGTQPRETQGNL